MKSIKELLDCVNAFEQANYKNLNNNKSAIFEKCATISLLSSFSFFVLLFLVGLSLKVTSDYLWLKELAIILILLLELFVFLFFIFQILNSLMSIKNRKQSMHEMLLSNMYNDSKNVELLSEYNKKLLEEAHQWLSLHSKRLQSRMSMIIEPSNLGLLSLVGLGYGAYQFILAEKINSWSLSNVHAIAILCPVALFVGLTIGAILVRNQINLVSYKMDILSIAIKLKIGK